MTTSFDSPANLNDNLLMALLQQTTSIPPMGGLTTSYYTDDETTTFSPDPDTTVLVTQFPSGGGGFGIGSSFTTVRTPSTSDHILLGICFIVGVLGIVGNAVMVISILAVRTFRQASNIFFFHHGLLEIAKSALIIPYALSITGKRATYCELLGAMQCVLVTTTSLNLAAITINQSFIISHTLPGAQTSFDEPEAESGRHEKRHNSQLKDQSSPQSNSRHKGGPKSSKNNQDPNVKIIPALEPSQFNKPSLKRNITCVVFGVLLIWMASLVLNMGVSLITGSGQYNEKIGLCYFVYGHQKSYVVNVMWIVVTSLGVGATIGCLRKLKLDLRRSQEYLMKNFPNNIRSNSQRSQMSNSGSVRGMNGGNAAPNLRQIEPANLNSQDNGTSSRKGSQKTPRANTIEERHHQRLSAMISKQAFQQTRLLNCQFNVIVLQTISFIVFWYPLFGLIIADKDFSVDTEIYKALTVLAWLNAPLTPVFFTYFNYECYSTQVAVRLSVVGNAAAQVVHEQAVIAEKLGKSSEQSSEGSENADIKLEPAAAKAEHTKQKPQKSQQRSQRAQQPAMSKELKNFPQPQLQRSFYNEAAQQQFNFSQQQQPLFSTFRSTAGQGYMGRSLHDLPQNSQDQMNYEDWYDRREFPSSNSLHKISRHANANAPWMDQQMIRTDTFPKLQYENEAAFSGPEQHQTFWTHKPSSRSLREIRDFRIAGTVNANPKQAVRFPIPPPPPIPQKERGDVFPRSHKSRDASPFEGGANRPHSYENLTAGGGDYNFDASKRSRTNLETYQRSDEDSQVEEDPEQMEREVIINRRSLKQQHYGTRQPPPPPAISPWTGVQNKQRKQASPKKQQQEGMCSWRQIAATSQNDGPQAPRSSGQSQTVKRNASKGSAPKNTTRRLTSEESSDGECVPPPKTPTNSGPYQYAPSRQQPHSASSKNQTPQPPPVPRTTPKGSLSSRNQSANVNSSTDVEQPFLPGNIRTQNQSMQQSSGFKNPLYIEAFRRANLRSQQAVVATSDEDLVRAIPMTEMAPPRQGHRTSDTPKLSYIGNAGPWSKSITETEDEHYAIRPSSGSKASTTIQVTRVDTLSPTGRHSARPVVIDDEDDEELEIPLAGTDEDDMPTTMTSDAAMASYTRIDTTVQTPAGSSVDRLQIWLGKLDNTSSSNQPQQQLQSATPLSVSTSPPLRGGDRASSRMGPTGLKTMSLIDEFHSKHQQQTTVQSDSKKPQSPQPSASAVAAAAGETSLQSATSPKVVKKTVTIQQQQHQTEQQSSQGSGSEQREVWI